MSSLCISCVLYVVSSLSVYLCIEFVRYIRISLRRTRGVRYVFIDFVSYVCRSSVMSVALCFFRPAVMSLVMYVACMSLLMHVL